MKRTILAAALFAIGTAAFAQTPQTTVQLPDPVKLTVSRAALQLIGQGVMKLPYETASPVLNDLQAQLTAQDKVVIDAAKAQADAAEAAAKKPEDKPAEKVPEKPAEPAPKK